MASVESTPKQVSAAGALGLRLSQARFVDPMSEALLPQGADRVRYDELMSQRSALRSAVELTEEQRQQAKTAGERSQSWPQRLSEDQRKQLAEIDAQLHALKPRSSSVNPVIAAIVSDFVVHQLAHAALATCQEQAARTVTLEHLFESRLSALSSYGLFSTLPSVTSYSSAAETERKKQAAAERSRYTAQEKQFKSQAPAAGYTEESQIKEFVKQEMEKWEKEQPHEAKDPREKQHCTHIENMFKELKLEYTPHEDTAAECVESQEGKKKVGLSVSTRLKEWLSVMVCELAEYITELAHHNLEICGTKTLGQTHYLNALKSIALVKCVDLSEVIADTTEKLKQYHDGVDTRKSSKREADPQADARRKATAALNVARRREATLSQSAARYEEAVAKRVALEAEAAAFASTEVQSTPATVAPVASAAPVDPAPVASAAASTTRVAARRR